MNNSKTNKQAKTLYSKVKITKPEKPNRKRTEFRRQFLTNKNTVNSKGKKK